MYGIRDKEAGNVIELKLTKEEAEKLLIEFEEQDKADGTYEEDFYETFFSGDIKRIEEKYSMNLRQISERFEIPYRTVQNWSSGQRSCPDYLLKMMDEILSKES